MPGGFSSRSRGRWQKPSREDDSLEVTRKGRPHDPPGAPTRHGRAYRLSDPADRHALSGAEKGKGKHLKQSTVSADLSEMPSEMRTFTLVVAWWQFCAWRMSRPQEMNLEDIRPSVDQAPMFYRMPWPLEVSPLGEVSRRALSLEVSCSSLCWRLARKAVEFETDAPKLWQRATLPLNESSHAALATLRGSRTHITLRHVPTSWKQQ